MDLLAENREFEQLIRQAERATYTIKI